MMNEDVRFRTRVVPALFVSANADLKKKKKDLNVKLHTIQSTEIYYLKHLYLFAVMSLSGD